MAKKRDEGHEETEKVLADIEKEISKEYAQAEKEISEKLDDYLRRFEKKDEIKYTAWQEGKITKEEYEQWRVGQIAVGKQWEAMKNTLADDYANAAQIAKSITDGHMPEVYSINHAYGTYQVEKVAGVDTKYIHNTMYDRQSVEHLFKGKGKLYHDYGIKTGIAIAEGKQKAWDRKQIQSVMTQSLLQGESIGKIATRLSKTVGDSDRKACIRNARTMATGVQNAGRTDSYKRAQGMGIKLEQEWLATLDSRTRHEHRMLDGQRVKVGEKFKVDGYELAFPADPEGEAFLVYNCRCTLVPALEGFAPEASDLSLRNTNHMEEETYEEWKESHNITSDSITKQDDIAEIMRNKYNNEYRSYKGENTRYAMGVAPNNNAQKPKNPITDGRIVSETFVKNRQEAYDSLSSMFGTINADMSKIDEKLLVENVNMLNTLNKRFGILTELNMGEITSANYKDAIAYTKTAYVKTIEKTRLGLCELYYSNTNTLVEEFHKSQASNFNMPASNKYAKTYTIVHEYGHMIESYVSKRRQTWLPTGFVKNPKKEENQRAKEIKHEIIEIAKKNNPNFKYKDNVSVYATHDNYEFFAEVFANSQCGKPNDLGKAMIEWLEKEGF